MYTRDRRQAFGVDAGRRKDTCMAVANFTHVSLNLYSLELRDPMLSGERSMQTTPTLHKQMNRAHYFGQGDTQAGLASSRPRS